jgi:hypothetical protein
MQSIRRPGMILAVVATLLVPLGARAQSTTTGAGPTTTARSDALAEVEAHRGLVIRDALDRWRFQFQPFDPARNLGGEEERITASLQGTSAQRLLAASQAQTYEEFLSALYGRWQGSTVIPLAPGPIPNSLGDSGDDLVFTPVTPCRIIDTRIASGGSAGRIGPNLGKQFSVSLADYSTQGGFAGSCGIPIAPAAVAINVTSVDQTGQGNLRVIQSGGGTPNVSLVNYNPGINIANAAVVASAGSLGGDNIFIYSGNSASHVVVDIMGYLAAPQLTALDVTNVTNSLSIGAGTNAILSVACPAGRTVTGGGCNFATFGSPLYFISSNPLSNGWNCAVQNRGLSADTLTVYARCGRVPGR